MYKIYFYLKDDTDQVIYRVVGTACIAEVFGDPSIVNMDLKDLWLCLTSKYFRYKINSIEYYFAEFHVDNLTNIAEITYKSGVNRL